MLERLEKGEALPEEWREFAVQRYLAALPFEDLLEGCKKAALEQGDSELAGVIDANLRDETGVNADGKEVPALSHGVWRKDFYSAMGIGEDMLDSASATEETRAYEQALRRLVGKSDPVIMAGALLVLEGTIPREFARIKRGRDISFPDIFLDQAGDSEETRKRKTRARLYIEDHIVHDAQSHYPDLLRAMERYAASSEGRRRIEEGAMAIAGAKKRFYAQWNV